MRSSSASLVRSEQLDANGQPITGKAGMETPGTPMVGGTVSDRHTASAGTIHVCMPGGGGCGGCQQCVGDTVTDQRRFKSRLISVRTLSAR